jgi:hypothetical protein
LRLRGIVHSLGSHRDSENPGVLSDTALHRPPPLFQARPGSWCVACARLRTVRAILWHRERALRACAGPGPGPGGRVAEEPCQPECSSFGLSHGDSGPGEPHDAGSMARRGIGNVAAGSLVIRPGPH